MADPSDRASQACLLVYDGECRFCVTAKEGFERLETHDADAIPIRMVPYQSEEAQQALGESYRLGRPKVAFLVRPNGEIARGLDAFLHDRKGLFPEEASLFALSMLLFTERGNTYSAAETRAWLTDAGFERIKVLRMKKGTEDWEGGILEARLPGTNVKMRARRTGSIKSSRSRSSH